MYISCILVFEVPYTRTGTPGVEHEGNELEKDGHVLFRWHLTPLTAAQGGSGHVANNGHDDLNEISATNRENNPFRTLEKGKTTNPEAKNDPISSNFARLPTLLLQFLTSNAAFIVF